MRVSVSQCPYLVWFFLCCRRVRRFGVLISVLSVLLLGVSLVGTIDLSTAQIAMRVSLFASSRALKQAKTEMRVLVPALNATRSAYLRPPPFTAGPRIICSAADLVPGLDYPH